MRLGREHDQQLVEIRCEEFGLVLIRPVEQVAALAGFDNHALIGRRGFIDHPVADGDIAAFAARETLQHRAAIFRRDKIMPAVRCDDDAADARRRTGRARPGPAGFRGAAAHACPSRRSIRCDAGGWE